MTSEIVLGEDPHQDDYFVRRIGPMIAVFGESPPTNDIQALLRGWDYIGYKYVASRVAYRLGAAVVVAKSLGDEEEWILKAGKTCSQDQ